MKAIDLGNHRSLENYRDLLIILVQKEIKVRYKNNVLGYLWSVGNPLMFAVVYFFAFKIIMRVRVEAYPLVLLAGLFPWQWFANSVGSSPKIFVAGSSIIKKVNFPRHIIPLASVLNHMIHFCFSLPVIIVLLLFYDKVPPLSWLYGMPIQIGVQLMMLYGISLLLASLNLFVRDIEPLASIIIQMGFFFTPIIYTEDLIPERFQHLIPLNPAAPLMINWRNLILEGTLNFQYVLISFGYGLLFLALGYSVYKKLAHRFAEVL
ncbi:MAG: ABC transporter permease [Kaiparowitsia implicata GSE-PSE-MK54-09C]|jgi:lipopolysaccharide transport system permease protein|nr:ABC transporter permease [Kaiparowitsia implicata GSE-PSE-MK54-09C]